MEGGERRRGRGGGERGKWERCGVGEREEKEGTKRGNEGNGRDVELEKGERRRGREGGETREIGERRGGVKWGGKGWKKGEGGEKEREGREVEREDRELGRRRGEEGKRRKKRGKRS